MKSEPSTYSIDDLERDGSEPWDGIRNYQARNFMREMRVGDLAIFYHSNAKPTGAVGVMRIGSTAKPDPYQFDKKSNYYDAGSKPEEPRWDLVDVEFVERFTDTVSLAELKAEPALEGMYVTRKGNRLSITPVEKHHFKKVLSMARAQTKIR